MVEEVKGLDSNLQVGRFPMGDPEALRDGEIRICVARSIHRVAATLAESCGVLEGSNEGAGVGPIDAVGRSAAVVVLDGRDLLSK